MASDVSSTEAAEPDDEKEEGEISLDDVSSSEEQQSYKFPPRAFGQCPHCLSPKRCHPWCKSLTFNGYYRVPDAHYICPRDVGLQGKENRKKQQSTKQASDLSSISTSSSSTLQEKNDVELAAALSSGLVPISSDSDMELVGLYDDTKRRKRRKLLKKLKKKKREKSPASCLDLALSIKDSIHNVEATAPVLLSRKDSSITSHTKSHRHHSPERKKISFVKSPSPVRKHRRSPPVTRSRSSSIQVAAKRKQKTSTLSRAPSPRHRSKPLPKKPVPVAHSIVDDALRDLPSPGGAVTKLLKKVRQLEPFSSRSKEKGSSLKDKLSNIIKKSKPENEKEKSEISGRKEEGELESQKKKESAIKGKDGGSEKENGIDSSDKQTDVIKDDPKSEVEKKLDEKSVDLMTLESNTETTSISASLEDEKIKPPSDVQSTTKSEEAPISGTEKTTTGVVSESNSPKSPKSAKETSVAVHEQIDSIKPDDSDSELIEEPPPPESQKLPNFIMDDNDEDLELRMIALRSAVLKKHRTRIQSGKVKKRNVEPQKSGSSSPAALPNIESPFTASFVEEFPLLAEVCRPETPMDLKKDIYCSEDMDLDSDMELAEMSDMDDAPYSPTDDLAPLLLDQDETTKSHDASLYTPSKPTETPQGLAMPSSRPELGHLDGSFLELVNPESRPYSPTDLTIYDQDLPGSHPTPADPMAPLAPPPLPPAALGVFSQPVILGCPTGLLNPFYNPVAAQMVGGFPALHQSVNPLLVTAPAGPLFAYSAVPGPQAEAPVEQQPVHPESQLQMVETTPSDDFGETDLDGSPLVPMDTKELSSSSSSLDWPSLGEPLYIRALDKPPSLVPSAVLRGNKQLLKQATLKRLQQHASCPNPEPPQSLFRSAQMQPISEIEFSVNSELASLREPIFKPLKLQPRPRRFTPLPAAPVFAEAASPDDEVAVLESRSDTPASSDLSSMTPSPRPGRRRVRRGRRSMKKTNDRWQELHSRALQEKNARQRAEKERQSTPLLEEDEEALREKLLASLKKKKEVAAAAAAKLAATSEENFQEQLEAEIPTLKRVATSPPPTETIVRKIVKRTNQIPASTKVVNNAKRFQNQLQQRKLLQQKLTLTVFKSRYKLTNMTRKVDVTDLEDCQTDLGAKKVLFGVDDGTISDNENVPPVDSSQNKLLDVPTADFEKSVDQFLKNVRQQHEHTVTDPTPKTLEEKITTVRVPSISPTMKSDIGNQLVNIKAVSAQIAASSSSRSIETDAVSKIWSSHSQKTESNNSISNTIIGKNIISNENKDCPALNGLLDPSKRPKSGALAAVNQAPELISSMSRDSKAQSVAQKNSITSVQRVVTAEHESLTNAICLGTITEPLSVVPKDIINSTSAISVAVSNPIASVTTSTKTNLAVTVVTAKPTTTGFDLNMAKKKLGLGFIKATSYESPIGRVVSLSKKKSDLEIPEATSHESPIGRDTSLSKKSEIEMSKVSSCESPIVRDVSLTKKKSDLEISKAVSHKSLKEHDASLSKKKSDPEIPKTVSYESSIGHDVNFLKNKSELGVSKAASYESPLLSLSVTPQAVKHLPLPQQEEYRRLKQQIIEREKMRLLKARELAASSSVKRIGNIPTVSSTVPESTIPVGLASPRTHAVEPTTPMSNTRSSITESSKNKSTAQMNTQLAAIIEPNTKKTCSNSTSVVTIRAKRTHPVGQVDGNTSNNIVRSDADVPSNRLSVANSSSNIENVSGKDQVDLLGKMTELLNNQKLTVSAVAQKVSKLRILTKEQINNQQNEQDRESPNHTLQRVDTDMKENNQRQKRPLLRILTKDQINQRSLGMKISFLDSAPRHVPNNNNQRSEDRLTRERRPTSLNAEESLQNVTELNQILSSNICQSKDSWSDFKLKVNEEVQHLIDLPAENQEKLLALCEEKLIVKRHAVLDDITEMSGNLRQWEVERDVQDNLAFEIKKLREQLKAAEEKMQQQKKKLSTIQPKISEYHEKINSGRKECFRLSKICSKLGQEAVGSSYIVPSAGAELLTNRIKEVAAHSQQLKNRKIVIPNNQNSASKPSPVVEVINSETGVPSTSSPMDTTNSDSENRTTNRDTSPPEEQVTDGTNVNMVANDNEQDLNANDGVQDMETNFEANETETSDDKKFNILDVKVEIKGDKINFGSNCESSSLTFLNRVKIEQSYEDVKPTIPAADHALSVKTEEPVHHDDAEETQNVPMDTKISENDCSSQPQRNEPSVPSNPETEAFNVESIPTDVDNLHHSGVDVTHDDVPEQSALLVDFADANSAQVLDPGVTENHDQSRSSCVQSKEVDDENTSKEIGGESSCETDSTSLTQTVSVTPNLHSVNELPAAKFDTYPMSNSDSNCDNNGKRDEDNYLNSDPGAERSGNKNQQSDPCDNDKNSLCLLAQNCIADDGSKLENTAPFDQQNSQILSSEVIVSQNDLQKSDTTNSNLEDDSSSPVNMLQNHVSEEPSTAEENCDDPSSVSRSVVPIISDRDGVDTSYCQIPIEGTPEQIPNTTQINPQDHSFLSQKTLTADSQLSDSSSKQVLTRREFISNDQSEDIAEYPSTQHDSDSVPMAIDSNHDVNEQMLNDSRKDDPMEIDDNEDTDLNKKSSNEPANTVIEVQTSNNSSSVDDENLENFYLHKSIDDIINGKNEEDTFSSNPFQVADMYSAEDSTFMEEIALLELANEMEVPSRLVREQKTTADANSVVEATVELNADVKLAEELAEKISIHPERCAQTNTNEEINAVAIVDGEFKETTTNQSTSVNAITVVNPPKDAKKQSNQSQLMGSLLERYKDRRKTFIRPYESVLKLVHAPRNDKLNGILCPFELMGTCNDGDCQYIHQSTSHC
ncbi:hypothetical protein QAD02_015098 [Eretmocerus hayati]|uniref:Uncharacterized protein n=1 Tax=Eretmocerus hayati TaxID=131215 RepID=A0ACC2P799_9HYME|nr:hypothetical protein QAD02_015098 [Eretmocerus hayati]